MPTYTHTKVQSNVGLLQVRLNRSIETCQDRTFYMVRLNHVKGPIDSDSNTNLFITQNTILLRITSFNVVFFVELNKTNEVKFWLTIYSYFDVSMIMAIIIKKK